MRLFLFFCIYSRLTTAQSNPLARQTGRASIKSRVLRSASRTPLPPASAASGWSSPCDARHVHHHPPIGGQGHDRRLVGDLEDEVQFLARGVRRNREGYTR